MSLNETDEDAPMAAKTASRTASWRDANARFMQYLSVWETCARFACELLKIWRCIVDESKSCNEKMMIESLQQS